MESINVTVKDIDKLDNPDDEECTTSETICSTKVVQEVDQEHTSATLQDKFLGSSNDESVQDLNENQNS